MTHPELLIRKYMLSRRSNVTSMTRPRTGDNAAAGAALPDGGRVKDVCIFLSNPGLTRFIHISALNQSLSYYYNINRQYSYNNRIDFSVQSMKWGTAAAAGEGVGGGRIFIF